MISAADAAATATTFLYQLVKFLCELFCCSDISNLLCICFLFLF